MTWMLLVASSLPDTIKIFNTSDIPHSEVFTMPPEGIQNIKIHFVSSTHAAVPSASGFTINEQW